MKRFSIIGYGAITDEIVLTLEKAASPPETEIAAVLVLPKQFGDRRQRAAGRFDVVTTLDALLASSPELIMEAAGQGAVRDHASRIVSEGVDFMCASVGALADDDFRRDMLAARTGNAQILIPSGAIAGIDGLLAARTAGLREASYTSIKGPAAWRGTPGEPKISESERVTLFEGTAREAAQSYPQNANVAATVAFAGLGLDRTRVALVSDPNASGPLGIVEAAGDFGTFRFETLAYASARNPKTSAITAHSMLMALREGVCFALS